jgi:hypothetical protein
MIEIPILVETLRDSVESLHADLKSTLGAAFEGVATRPGQTILHMADNSTPEQHRQAIEIVKAHDPNKRTDGQQDKVRRKTDYDLIVGQNFATIVSEIAVDLSNLDKANTIADIKSILQNMINRQQQLLAGIQYLQDWLRL